MGIIFKKQPPITGGNSYTLNERLNAQEKIDLSSRYHLAQVKDSLLNKGKQKAFLDERTIDPYWLLQLQANYFCNIIQFECDSPYFKEMIIKVIRCAFLNGKAGIIFDKLTNKVYAVSVSNVEYDLYGNIISVDYQAIDSVITSESTKAISRLKKLRLYADETKQIAVFNWGTLGISAWVIMWPFIKQQASLLRVMNTMIFSFIKKFIYKVNDPLASKDEMELFFDLDNPFIIETGLTDGIKNKFSAFEVGNTGSQKDYIDYYEKSIQIWYDLFGRRLNTDTKKERNIVAEVDASQESYDNLHLEICNQFDIFAERVKLLALDFNLMVLNLERNKKVEQEELRDGTE